MAVLLIYSYIASVLPVWMLLQPRDFINSLQLLSALGLVVVGLIVAAMAFTDRNLLTPVTETGGVPHVVDPRTDLGRASGKGRIPNLSPGRYRLYLANEQNSARQHLPITFVQIDDVTIAADAPAVLEIDYTLTAKDLATLRKQ